MIEGSPTEAFPTSRLQLEYLRNVIFFLCLNLLWKCLFNLPQMAAEAIPKVVLTLR
jgi:hypothetical protein